MSSPVRDRKRYSELLGVIPMSEESLDLQTALMASMRSTRLLLGYSLKELAADLAEVLPDMTYRKLKSKEYGESRLFAHELMALTMFLGPVRTWVLPDGHHGEVLKKFRNCL